MSEPCFLVRVSTGCTCCASDNFIEGPYLTREGAETSAESHKNRRTLSSQYAANGCQEILEASYEQAGEWIILNEKYAIKGSFTDPENEVFAQPLDMFDRDWRL